MSFGSVVFVRTRMARQKFTDEKMSDVLVKTWLFKYPNWTVLKTVLQKVLKNTFKDNVLFCKQDRFHKGHWWLEICFKQEISSTLLTLTWQIIWCSKIYKRLFFAKQVWYLHKMLILTQLIVDLAAAWATLIRVSLPYTAAFLHRLSSKFNTIHTTNIHTYIYSNTHFLFSLICWTVISCKIWNMNPFDTLFKYVITSVWESLQK